MATKTKKSISDLGRAAAERGRDSGGVIAQNVIDRIVSNSTREFQDFLSRAGSGSAAANAASIAPSAPAPVPYGDPSQMDVGMPLPPTPFGNPAAMAMGAMPDPMGTALQPAPFAEPPPSLMPSPLAMPNISPSVPNLMPTAPKGIDPGMERLLRQFGLI